MPERQSSLQAIVSDPTDFLLNPLRGEPTDLISGGEAALEFHRQLPGYRPTPLLQIPDIAQRLSVGSVLAKVESSRFGLPAFKLLGASWATYNAVLRELGHTPQWDTIDDLHAALEPLRPLTLTTATDGNHGRAVARMAELLGFECVIFVPKGMVEARISAISSHGAIVTVVDGEYDDAVRAAAQFASDRSQTPSEAPPSAPRCLVISDTSWPGYVLPPRDVIAGYSTIFAELDEQLAAERWAAPTHWFVPAGVGALLAAVVAAVRSDENPSSPTRIICVEPVDADCLLESARAGEITEVPGPHRSQMVGLNCGTPSPEAWESVKSGTDAFIGVPDSMCEAAVRLLAANGVNAGETGSAALAGALAAAITNRVELGITPDSCFGIIVTEGVTDPQNWSRITGVDMPETP